MRSFNLAENTITGSDMMTEQINIDSTKSARKVFSKIGLGLVIFTLLSNVVAVVSADLVVKFIPFSWLQKYSMLISLGISLVAMYFIALPLCTLFWRKMEKSKPQNNKFSLFSGFKVFSIAIFLSVISQIISSMIQSVLANTVGTTFTQDTVDMIVQMKWYEAAIPTVVIFPFFEELLFRKLIIDRTKMYGEKLSIAFSALLFAFFHCSIDQFFYTFALGLLLGYVYVNTGKLKLCWLLHALFNLWGSIIPLLILQGIDYEYITEIAMSEELILSMKEMIKLYISSSVIIIYEMFHLAFVVFGGIFCWKLKHKNVRFSPAEKPLPKDSEGMVAFVNVGVILCVAVSVITILLSAV